MFLNYTNFHFFRFVSSLKHKFSFVFFKLSIFSFSVLFFLANVVFLISFFVKGAGLYLNPFFYLTNLSFFDFSSISLVYAVAAVLAVLFFIHSFFSILAIINDYVYNSTYRLFLFLIIVSFYAELILAC